MEFFDYVALLDLIERSNILNREDYLNLNRSLNSKSYFTNRKKVNIADVLEAIELIPEKDQLIELIESKKYAIKF